MKIILLSVSFLFLFFGCQKNSTGINDSESQIILTTDKSSYVQSDTIKVTLRNNSDADIVFTTRNGCMILYYQRYQNNGWSDILDLNNCPWKVPDVPDTLKPNGSFTQNLEPGIFSSTGTFRLVVKLIAPKQSVENSGNRLKVFSNSFEIKKD